MLGTETVMALFSPQTVIPDLLLHHDRSSFAKCEVAKHTLQSSSLLVSTARRHPFSGRRSFQRAAIIGGSHRDGEKLVARARHRRSRHTKGGTPSPSDSTEELEEQDAAEDDVPKEVTEIAGFSGSSSKEPEGVRLRNDIQVDNTGPIGKKNQQREPLEGSSTSDVVNDAADGVKGVLETTEDTATDVVDKAADTQKEIVSDAVTAGESLVESATDVVSEQSSTSSSDSEEETSSDIRSSTREVGEIASDTTSDVGRRVTETGQQVQQDIVEAASDVGDTIGSQTDAAFENVNKQASEARDSADSVADIAVETISDVNKTIGKTAEQLGQDFSEVVSTSQQAARDSRDYTRAQAKDLTSQAEGILQKEGDVLEQGFSRLQIEANRSLSRVQDSVQKAVRESARAARDVGSEALGLGELLIDTAKEAIQGTSDVIQNRESRAYSKGEEKGNVSRTEDLKPQSSYQKDESSFTEFKVLVAGAAGQTGRVLTEILLRKGASVRALVRDVYRAQSISQLKDSECVEADLYNYKSVRKAIDDCNVVICAVGTRAFPFDPFHTYQVEYEGLLNLISAAKNQGKVQKFILISTIGVTYLQFVPLIFWKKQGELYLQRSGLDYTIVRPGGLRNTSGPENVVLQGPDSQYFGGISRKKVAEVCVSALVSSDASRKIVEVVSLPGPQKRSIVDLFKQV